MARQQSADGTRGDCEHLRLRFLQRCSGGKCRPDAFRLGPRVCVTGGETFARHY